MMAACAKKEHTLREMLFNPTETKLGAGGEPFPLENDRTPEGNGREVQHPAGQRAAHAAAESRSLCLYCQAPGSWLRHNRHKRLLRPRGKRTRGETTGRGEVRAADCGRGDGSRTRVPRSVGTL
ncbi:hypothetical protein NDU88_009647 [Pleurodeles waltl]|uniref:Uncharacterized protein n=1 Tax=Pleurodeles waltl TaxID=8319 RepID=A0AAV7RWN9_PLEWA|nr:hypothetical protein NDU88_009647 [Pleurodeles waltl]